MIEGFRAGWRGLRSLEHQGYVYIWANLLWILLSLPIITAPAAWAGLIRLSYHTQRSPTAAQFDEFWQGFRENLKRGALLALVNVAVIGVNVVNLLAYRDANGLAADTSRTVWTLVLLLWVTLQLYAWPLFYAMEQPSLRGAFRNAAVMITLNPLFTLAILLLMAVLIALSTLFPAAWLLLTGAALASIASAAVQNRIRASGIGTTREAAPALSDEAFFQNF